VNGGTVHSSVVTVEDKIGQSNPQIVTSFSSLIGEKPLPVILRTYPPRKELNS